MNEGLLYTGRLCDRVDEFLMIATLVVLDVAGAKVEGDTRSNE